jgi:NADH-quinone oxidoreductase subunit H
MGADAFEITVNAVKMLVIFLLMVQLVPILVWVERRGSAFIQNRLGPNRVGPLGLVQLLADAVKFLFKEEFVPGKSRKYVFYAAPIVALVPGAIAFGSIPLSSPITVEAFQMLGQSWGPYNFDFQSFNFGIGIVFVLGISSLGAYALLMAGWGSQNKYSMLGALRACAQTISYELALGLSLVGILLAYGTFDFNDMIATQTGPLAFTFAGQAITIPFLPNWGIFYQPVGFIIYFCAIFAETNRLPFDLPEAEGELVVGYHTEYGGLKMLMFYIGEYGHMMVGSAIAITLFLGGYNIPFVTPEQIQVMFSAQGFGLTGASLLTSLVLHVVMITKILLLLWVFIWVRWTLPRFRYDQLMDLGWKTMLPWALANVLVTAGIMVLAKM